MEGITINRTFMMIFFGSLLVIAIILFLLGEWFLGVLVPVFCGGYYLLARRSVSKGKGSGKGYKSYGDFDNDEDDYDSDDAGDDGDSGDSGGSDD
jgi:hypothetical protein